MVVEVVAAVASWTGRKGIGMVRLAGTGAAVVEVGIIGSSRRREGVLGRIATGRGGFLGGKVLGRGPSVVIRLDRILGPIVWIGILHGGVCIGDIRVSRARRGRGRGGERGGPGCRAHRGGSGWYAGGLESLVGVTHGRLRRRRRLGSIFGGRRGQAVGGGGVVVVVERLLLRGTTSHQGVLIRPLGIHLCSFVFFFIQPGCPRWLSLFFS